MSISGWVGVDLDGTLARYDGWKGVEHIGEPVLPMLKRVRDWLEEGISVKIFTARVCDGSVETRKFIEDWCEKHVGVVLPVTNIKDYAMVELWDDRAIQIEMNTGRRMDGNAY